MNKPHVLPILTKPALLGQNEGFHLLKIFHFLDCFMDDELYYTAILGNNHDGAGQRMNPKL
jgi:hypothetical protein